MPLPKENLEHECFRQPPDEAIPVWRYMDVTRLMSIILRDQLTLSRLDTLPDKFEGLHGRHFEQRFREDTAAFLAARAANGIELQSANFDELAANVLSGTIAMRQRVRQVTFVSCWRMGANESEAMWRIYGSAPSSVAIVLPYQRLRDSLSDPFLFIGMINYFDYERSLVSATNAFFPVMSKRQEFDFENEVRIVSAKVILNDPLLKVENLSVVESVLWDAAAHIEKIVVSPYTPRWQSDTIRDVVQRINPALAERIVNSEMSQ
jgi:hypothetical protein